MQVFVLSKSTRLCARYHCDVHVNKMIVESAQLLCAFHHWNKTSKSWMYKKTHTNHPLAVWVRGSHANYMWLLELAEALSAEYTYRYHRRHKTDRVIARLRVLAGNKHTRANPTFTYSGAETSARTVVGKYRELYHLKSWDFTMRWTGRPEPAWFHRVNE